jgi:hypothetical protein
MRATWKQFIAAILAAISVQSRRGDLSLLSSNPTLYKESKIFASDSNPPPSPPPIYTISAYSKEIKWTLNLGVFLIQLSLISTWKSNSHTFVPRKDCNAKQTNMTVSNYM